MTQGGVVSVSDVRYCQGGLYLSFEIEKLEKEFTFLFLRFEIEKRFMVSWVPNDWIFSQVSIRKKFMFNTTSYSFMMIRSFNILV